MPCRQHPLSTLLVAGWFSRAMLPRDQVLQPYGLVALSGNTRRLQGFGPIADLRVIKYVSTALRQNREKQIALPKLEKELAVYRGIDVHQPDGAAELFMPLPHALDLNLPGVRLCFHDLPGKYILGAVKTGFGRD